jgi:hypothetical protein
VCTATQSHHSQNKPQHDSCNHFLNASQKLNTRPRAEQFSLCSENTLLQNDRSGVRRIEYEQRILLQITTSSKPIAVWQCTRCKEWRVGSDLGKVGRSQTLRLCRSSIWTSNGYWPIGIKQNALCGITL